MYRRFFKRFLDFWIALVALVVLSPVLLVVTVWLHFANKGAGDKLTSSSRGGAKDKSVRSRLAAWFAPVFFLQERPGKDARIFRIIKFKTMTDERDADGNLLPDAQRLTRVGRFVRSTSIDELPQLINVLKGDMALIGPRPLLVWFLPLYDKHHSRRHEVRPGITGWAQVKGRNALTYSQKFNYDVWYVDNLSFLLDAKILWMSIIKVLKRSDIGMGDADDDIVDDLCFEERHKAEIARR